MKKIGITTSGSILVEMTPQEYEALQRLQGTQVESPTHAKSQELPPTPMSHSDKASYVAERLKKLGPKRKDAVARSIETMFQFNGGIESKEVDKLITTLQKQKFFTIDRDGSVTYSAKT